MKITKEVQDKLYAKLTEGIRDNLIGVNESDLRYATMNCLSTCVDFAEEQCKEKEEEIKSAIAMQKNAYTEIEVLKRKSAEKDWLIEELTQRLETETEINNSLAKDQESIIKKSIDALETAKNIKQQADKLIALKDKYADLLVEEINELVVTASLSGWKSSRFEKGRLLREEIEQALNDYKNSQTT